MHDLRCDSSERYAHESQREAAVLLVPQPYDEHDDEHYDDEDQLGGEDTKSGHGPEYRSGGG
jgi:hypothetical protein